MPWGSSCGGCGALTSIVVAVAVAPDRGSGGGGGMVDGSALGLTEISVMSPTAGGAWSGFGLRVRLPALVMVSSLPVSVVDQHAGQLGPVEERRDRVAAGACVGQLAELVGGGVRAARE